MESNDLVRITLQYENRRIEDVDEIREFLKPFGI